MSTRSLRPGIVVALPYSFLPEFRAFKHVLALESAARSPIASSMPGTARLPRRQRGFPILLKTQSLGRALPEEVPLAHSRHAEALKFSDHHDRMYADINTA